MKNVLKQIQDSLSPQHTYYFQIQFDHITLPQNLIENLAFKDSFSKVILFKDNKQIACTQPTKSTILGQMLLLNLVRLKFSATLFDIQRNAPIMLKIMKTANKQQQEVMQFKLVPAKYVQCYNLEGKKYFNEKFKSKLGLVIEMLICIEKSRVKLQKIIKQVQTEKKRRRSQSAKKSRLKSPLVRNIIKNKQKLINNQQENNIKQKNLHSSALNQKNIQQKHLRNSFVEKNQGNKTKNKRFDLLISHITQINSEQYSELSRSFSNSPIIFQKQAQQKLTESQNNYEIQAQKIISQPSQFTEKQLQSRKISLNSAPYSDIYSQDQSSSNLSRSFGIVHFQSQDSTSISSSRISNSSDLNNFKQKRNKTCYIFLIIIGFFLLINALRPSLKIKKAKRML